MNPTDALSPCIGVFDSGVGGLSVLNAIRRRLPDGPLIYLGDVAYAPYGERAVADVVERCQLIVGRLVGMGASVVVVACNTASVLGIAALRQRWPAVTFVGVEPGVKPAAALTRTRRIAVMATPATASSDRLRYLIDTFAADTVVAVVPCAGLAATIEQGIHSGPPLDAVLAPLCAQVVAARPDVVVLGCTHYPFVAQRIRELVGDHITLLDTASAVAERVASVWPNSARDQRRLQVMSTGRSVAMRALLRVCDALEQADVAHSPI